MVADEGTKVWALDSKYPIKAALSLSEVQTFEGDLKAAALDSGVAEVNSDLGIEGVAVVIPAAAGALWEPEKNELIGPE